MGSMSIYGMMPNPRTFVMFHHRMKRWLFFADAYRASIFSNFVFSNTILAWSV